ncbi:unnamed protein product [Protopolystoma xenopodis]|uniref:Uncharacterized protein n=1 Tax=Protopolystoma xenopodis TaxID=117903 RepID=A0A448WA73_9PLAT|nr:unnamed protein product [Protopolystoma xenopodis]
MECWLFHFTSSGEFLFPCASLLSAPQRCNCGFSSFFLRQVACWLLPRVVRLALNSRFPVLSVSLTPSTSEVWLYGPFEHCFCPSTQTTPTHPIPQNLKLFLKEGQQLQLYAYVL